MPRLGIFEEFERNGNLTIHERYRANGAYRTERYDIEVADDHLGRLASNLLHNEKVQQLRISLYSDS